MTFHHLGRHVRLVCLVFAAIAGVGCGGASSDEVQVSETRADGSKLSADDKAAAEVLRAKLAEHYAKGPDGWTTQFQQYNMLGQVMEGMTPTVLYRQYRALSFTIAPEHLTEAQKLNGADYRGVASFKDAPVRYYQTEANYEGPQGWGNWKDASLMFTTVVVERRNGQWLNSDSDLFEGVKPDPAAVPSGP